MAKKINDQPENIADASPTKASNKSNVLAYIWLAAFLIICTFSALIMLWLEYSFTNNINTSLINRYKTTYSKTISDSSSQSLNNMQARLDNIANSSALKNALLNNDEEQLATIQSTISNTLNDIHSFQIIPWDLTGTAGLKAHNIEARNNVELMLISSVGNKKIAAPEVYLFDKVWLTSFSSAVIVDDNVIAVLLLTFNANYLSNVFNIPEFTENARLTVYLKKQNKQPILAIGKGSSEHNDVVKLGFTDGEMRIKFNEDTINKQTLSFVSLQIALGLVLLLVLIVAAIGYKLSSIFIKKDIRTIRNYIESLGALHKTKQPHLHIRALSFLLDPIETLGARSMKTTITSEVDANYKSPQALTLPDIINSAEVSDKNEFAHPEIFRDYDIRGIADKELDSDSVVMIGKAIGSEALDLGLNTIIVGRDGRLSSERIAYDISRGITSTGCNIIDVGLVPSPVLYYSISKLNIPCGVMVTGSHNPAEYNGLKVVINNKALAGEDIQNLLKRIENYDFSQGQGKISKQDVRTDYIQDISSDIIIARPLSVVVDAGNGVGGEISTQLLTLLDCEVTPLYCEVDGSFPNHGPDPSIRANLTQLINKVKEVRADLGIAFDGDADRMVAVTGSGQVLKGDQVLMLFAKDIVSRNAGSSVLYDVKCSSLVENIVNTYGGRAIMSKSGHSHLKTLMKESGALLGGEFTGHFYFNERWHGFDDGIYAALRLLELLSTIPNNLDEEVAKLPTRPSTNELSLPLHHFDQAKVILQCVKKSLENEPCKINTLDGIRAEFSSGWGLIRASNTSTSMSLRFEADSEEELTRIQAIFQTAINSLNFNLPIPI
jgi:phosphomannomutase/phosphoglucomutase